MMKEYQAGDFDMRKVLGGNSDFKTIIEGKGLYVDKTLFIEEIFEEGWQIQLFTRPRRFGKTTNLSMLSYFFDIVNAKENRKLFNGLAIEKSTEIEHFGQYPVIFLTFKDARHGTKEKNIGFINMWISEVYKRKRYLLNTLDGDEKKYFNSILFEEEADYSVAIYKLCKYLYSYHKKKVVVLIDEYDTPINTAYVKGYYDEITDFFKSFYSSSFKDNPYLEKGILTGINRIAKEGLFSGLNNVGIYSVLSDKFEGSFGFTEKEVEELLKEYELEDKFEDVKKWYDGYNINGISIYNPWSMTNYVHNRKLRTYWINTSSNEEITIALKELANKGIFNELEKLSKGECVKAEINEHIVINNLKEPNQLWNLMLNAGYLTSTGEKRGRYELRIPNFEIQQYFSAAFIENFITDSFRFKNIMDYIADGEIENFKRELKEYIEVSSSYMISDKENFYQGFMLGLFMILKPYFDARIERETGEGRCDLYLKALNKNEMSYIIEMKVTKDESEMKKMSERALEQIKSKKYYIEMKAEKIEKLALVGITFCGKKTEFVYEMEI